MNVSPQILPALRHWEGGAGYFSPDANTVLVSPPPQICAYFQNLLYLSPEVVSDERGYNEIRFLRDEILLPDLGKEGYRLTVGDDTAEIRAATEIGLLYGGITLVQGMFASPAHTFPCGTAEDFPAYPVRSGMLDVARAYIPIEELSRVGKYMAWFKLNELHLHINDTGKNGYSAFRLESDVPGLTSMDGFYTKAEYRALQEELRAYGVTVVTEIDTPYHSSCFSKITEDPPRMLDETDPVPQWCRGLCLDIRREHTVNFVKNLLAEYLAGDTPVFTSPVVHIGMDEYPASMKAEMTAYVEEIVHYVNSMGYTPRFWSGLGKDGCMNPLTFSPDASVQLNYWDFGTSGPTETVEAGFPVVNSINAYLYTVPGNAEAKLGGYTDCYRREDLKLIYERWQVNLFSLYAEKKELLPPCHPALLGASFSIWNDSHSSHLGLTYRDVLDRVLESTCLVSEKTWCGEDTRGITFHSFSRRMALHCCFCGDADLFHTLLPGEELTAEPAAGILSHGFTFNGKTEDAFLLDGKSYLTHTRPYVGFPCELECTLTLSSLPTQTLPFFASADGGVTLSVSPEGELTMETKVTEQDCYLYTFGYRISAGVAVTLRLVSDRFRTTLYAAGECYPAYTTRWEQIGEPDLPKGRYSTLSVPLFCIGEGFYGKLHSIKIKNHHRSEDSL